MILVAHENGSKELAPLIRKYGGVTEITQLPYGDFQFDGKGPKGVIYIGIERKTLHDMLDCIDTARYSAHQKVGMGQMYDLRYLLLEGEWRPHDENGLLMEGFRNRDGKTSWGYCKPAGRAVMYSKLRRYLLSVALAGVQVIYTRDMDHTAYDIMELYHYFQKPWDKHTSMLTTQKIALPDLRAKPPLVRRWAAELDGVGDTLSMAAERHFPKAGQLAIADESVWSELAGVSIKKAKQIVKEIWG